MTKLFLIAASALMSIASAPVLAREPAPTPTPNMTTTTSAPAERAATPHATQRYCVIDTITGSRIPIRKCLTRTEWIMEGFDPLHPDQ